MRRRIQASRMKVAYYKRKAWMTERNGLHSKLEYLVPQTQKSMLLRYSKMLLMENEELKERVKKLEATIS